MFHGWGGSDYPHWQSWLASQIAKEYGCVDLLPLPDPNHPRLDRWMRSALDAIGRFNPNVIICHSLGVILWFHLCNNNLIARRVSHLILVAPPSLECTIEELSSFFPVEPPSDLFAKEALLVLSDNDPYLCLTESQLLQERLGIPTKILKGAGHINAQSGYGAWEWMLEYLKGAS